MKRRDFVLKAASAVATMMPFFVGAAETVPCPPPMVGVEGGSNSATNCSATPAGTPAWLQGKPVYQWVQLQSPRASGAAPNPSPPGNTAAITNAWGGGAVRRNGSHYLLHGGGHGDYAGNEIYSLKLSDDSPTWQRIWGPTPNAQITTSTLNYADGNPASVHTYYFNVYDDVGDRFLRFTRGWYKEPSGLAAGVDGWQWGATNWLPNAQNQTLAMPPENLVFGAGVAQDTNSNVYVKNGWNRLVWTRSTNKWTVSTGNVAHRQEAALVHDSKRNVMWSFGGGSAQVYKWDLGSNSESVVTPTGPSAGAVSAKQIGAAYDPVADRVYLYDGTGSLYEFNPGTLAVNTVSTTGTAPGSNASYGNQTGTYNKFRYVPALGGFVIAPDWTAPTFFIRTH